MKLCINSEVELCLFAHLTYYVFVQACSVIIVTAAIINTFCMMQLENSLLLNGFLTDVYIFAVITVPIELRSTLGMTDRGPFQKFFFVNQS